jgi:hypothetical protein
VTRWITWQSVLAAGVTALAVVAMFFDHMIDVEEGFPADPVAFAISAALVLATAAIVFGVVVPRATGDSAPPETAATRGFVCSLVSVLSLPGVWLGLPFVLAGGAITLGLLGRDSGRRRLAIAAIFVGAVVLVLALVGTDWGSED